MTFTHDAPRILLVEDDLNFRQTLEVEFKDRGYLPRGVSSLSEMASVLSLPFRFAVVDLRLAADYGLSVVKVLSETLPLCRIVVLTGYGTVATAVKAMQLGAINYLTKPVSMEILERALWLDISSEKESSTSPMTLARHEREYIEFVLGQCSGNITKAAQWLGLHRQSLQRKLKKLSGRV